MGGQVRPELVQRSFAEGAGGAAAPSAPLPQPPEVDGATVFQPLPEVSGEEALAACLGLIKCLLTSSEVILSIAVTAIERTNILEARGIEMVCRIWEIDRLGLDSVCGGKWNGNTTEFISLD